GTGQRGAGDATRAPRNRVGARRSDPRRHAPGGDAGGETRTPKGSRPPAPKAGVSTDSTTPAARPQATRKLITRAGVAAPAQPSRRARLGAQAVSSMWDVDLRSTCARSGRRHHA